MKYILVSGGVISGVGKGVVASSIGKLLTTAGYTVTIVKMDPYLNYDAGYLKPTDHGEVFVLDDGCEVDLDFGSYERFLDISLSRLNSITSGRMYYEMISKERAGECKGSTVQMIPHLTNHIQSSIEKAANTPVDKNGNTPTVCIIELGGTLGDIESCAFIESLRRLKSKVGPDNFISVGVDYVLKVGQEDKTKPVQASMKKARELGISYDIIICRSVDEINGEAMEKIASFSDNSEVINVPNGEVCMVPILLKNNGILQYLNRQLKLWDGIGKTPFEYENYKLFEYMVALHDITCTICVVTKYASNNEAYLSIKESLKYAGNAMGCEIKIEWIDAEALADEKAIEWKKIKGSDGVIVPGGFGIRGTEEMITAIKYCRVNDIPLLGICLGMQLMAIEFSRNVLKEMNSISLEFARETKVTANDKYVINENPLGMKLGGKEIELKQGSVVAGLYKSQVIRERFRSRYGVCDSMVADFEKNGLEVTGRCEGSVASIEKDDLLFFVGVQYHPEFLSKPGKPNSLFDGFVSACMKYGNLKCSS